MEGHQQEQVALKAFNQILSAQHQNSAIKTGCLINQEHPFIGARANSISSCECLASGNVLPKSSAHISTGQVYTTRVHGRSKLLHLWTHQTEIITSVLVRFNYKCTYVMSVVVILLFRRLTFLLFAMSPGTMYSSRIWCQNKIFFFVICILQQLLYSQTFFCNIFVFMVIVGKNQWSTIRVVLSSSTEDS